MLENARKNERERMHGQKTLFDMFDENDESVSEFVDSVPEPDGIEWDKMDLLKREKEIMNMYVTDNPVRPYMPQIMDEANYNISQLAELEHGIPNGKFGGMISDITTMRTKRGTLMSKFKLEDTTGSIEAICFDHEKNGKNILEDAIVLVRGKFEKADRGDQIIVYEANPVILNPNYKPKKQTMTVEEIKPLEIYLNEQDISEDKINRMNQTLQNNFGAQEVFLNIAKADGKNIRAQMPFKVNSENGNLKPQISTIFEKVRFN